MSNVYNLFLEKKKADSPFISLKDGESITIKELKNIEIIKKAGFAGGDEKDALRLTVDVETSEGIREKSFDNRTQKFAQELADKNVEVGDSFLLVRAGMTTKTRYIISNLVKKNPDSKKEVKKEEIPF